MKCKHKFNEIKRQSYIDFNGFEVVKIIYKCEKCGKKHSKKVYSKCFLFDWLSKLVFRQKLDRKLDVNELRWPSGPGSFYKIR